MKGKWRWIAIAGALLMVLTIGGYIWFQSEMKHVREAAASFSFPGTMLGIRAGDVVPSEGRVITEVSTPEGGLDLVVPIVLYPHAQIQAINVHVLYDPFIDGKTWTASILVGTDDPEEQVLDYYLTAWRDYGARPLEQRASALYSDVAPETPEHTVLATAKKAVLASASIQRGPAVRVMDDVLYAKHLRGEADLPLDPPGRQATEIWLIVPLHGGPTSRSPSSPVP